MPDNSKPKTFRITPANYSAVRDYQRGCWLKTSLESIANAAMELGLPILRQQLGERRAASKPNRKEH